MKIANKVIVITGANRGLGKVMADIFKLKGGTVVVSDIEGDNVDIKADVTKESDVKAITNYAINKYGRIDIWINNAGIWMPVSLIEEIDLQKAQKLFQVNFFGTLNGMRSAVLQMKRQESNDSSGGMIVNIISTTAIDGLHGSSGSMYVASKYAIKGLTNCVRDEIIGSEISVIGVYPGGIKTELFGNEQPNNISDFMSVDFVAEKIVENLEKDIPENDLILLRPGQQ